MKNALGIIELGSIARGIESCDCMLKAAKVELLRATSFCPGKYMVIIAGDTDGVTSSIKAGKICAAECLIDTLLIPNIHPQVNPAVSVTSQITEYKSVGVLEFYSVASAIIAADTAAKAANITLIEVRVGFAIGGKGFVTLTGDVGSVRAAVDAASKSTELLVGTSVIPHPDPRVLSSLL